ncbi:SpoIIE family protein phosphatase [Streptomyces sp. NPDC053079]|uniref:SpoIIE family protein phosphatase n=1 Tax=Streptomyces sp. NPDC053079 TaxID=3365697 RepID=UPI0037D20FEB
MAEPPPAGRTGLATLLIDPDGRVQQWSTGAQDLTGYSEPEIIGQDAALLADGATLRGNALVRALLRTAGQLRTDWLRRREGTCRSVAWYPVAVPLADGQGVLAVAALEAQPPGGCDPAAVERLVHATPVGLAVVDTELRFRFINGTCARLNGKSVEDHLGRRVADVLTLPDPEAYEEVLRRVVDHAETVENLRVSALRPDGEPMAVIGTLFPLRDSDGTITGAGGFVHELRDSPGELLDLARSRRRLDLLSRVSARIARQLDPRRVVGQLTAACVPEFAGSVAVDLLQSSLKPATADTEERGAKKRHAPSTAPRVHSLAPTPAARDPLLEEELPPARPAVPAVADCVRLMKPVVFEGDEATSARCGVVVPLITTGEVLGAVTFFSHGAPFTDEDVLLVQEVAARTATAIGNALLYRRERLAALALQRHLLPAQLPSVPWCELAHRYRPAEDDTLAGGDWYDAVLLPGGRIGLSMGDVMGHGVQAAAAMGRYRSSAHALLATGLPPGHLLTRLDQLSDGGPGDLGATCACVVYDGVTGRCRLALAGHPPPLAIRPDGTAGPLHAEPGPPLGMGLHQAHHHTEHSLPPGSLLVFYTDGVIEDPAGTLDLDQAIDVLGRAVRDPRAPLDEVCDALMATRPAASTDDAALLVARLGRL